MATLEAQELLTDPFLGQKAEAASAPLLAPATDPLIKEIKEARAGRKAASKDVGAAEAEIIKSQEEKVKPALEELETQARKHGAVPKELTDYKEEPPPSMAIRPFLDADTKNSIQAVVAGIGTLITAAIGGRAPIAAMHAFTGAMDGWAAGDMERANRSFQDYQARLGKLHRETEMGVKRAEWARQLSMDDLERAQAWVTTSLADVGMSEKVAELKEKGLARWLQDETMAWKVYDSAVKQYNEQIKRGIEAANAKARQRQADAAMLRAEAYMKSVGLQKGAAKELAKIDEQLNANADRLQMLRRVKGSLERLNAAGGLPTGGTGPQKYATSAARWAYVLADPRTSADADNVKSWGTDLIAGRALQTQYGKVLELRFKGPAQQVLGDLLDRNIVWWREATADMEHALIRDITQGRNRKASLQSQLAVAAPATKTSPLNILSEQGWEPVEEP